MENKQNDEEIESIRICMKNASEKIQNIHDNNKLSEAIKKYDVVIQSKHKIESTLFKKLNNARNIRCNEFIIYNSIMSVEDQKEYFDDYDEYKKNAKKLAKEFAYCPSAIEEDVNLFKVDYQKHLYNVPDYLIDRLYLGMYGLEWAYKRKMNSPQYQNEMKFYEDNNLENPFEIFHPLCLNGYVEN